jgi:hypothetical protein
MRSVLLAGLMIGAVTGGMDRVPAAAEPMTAKSTVKVVQGKDSAAAAHTRTKLLKAKVTVDFKNDIVLREALKELAAQVEMQAEKPVLWTYLEDIRAGQKVTYRCKDKPLDEALGDLFTRLKLGYVVVSDEDNVRDGWVRVTTGAERGYRIAAEVVEEDEKKAAARLATAKEFFDKGRTASAKAVLNGIIETYPKTKAATEAKTLLEKLDK